MKMFFLAAAATVALAGSAFAAPQPAHSTNGQTMTGYVTFVDPSTDTVMISNQPYKVDSAEIAKLAPGDNVVIRPSATESTKSASAATPATVVSVTG